MTQGPSYDWPDMQLVSYIHQWAIERSKCGLDGYAYNRISEEHLFPAMQILRERGPASVAKVLPMLADDNPDVRLAAAAFAYKIDPPRCLAILKDLMKTPSVIGMMAYGSLWLKDPGAAPDLVALWGHHFPDLIPKR